MSFVLKWVVVLGIWGALAAGGVVAWYASSLPDLDAALSPTRKPSIMVLAADGTSIATFGDFFGHAVTVDDLPPALPEAVIATEDRRFYHHFGIDPLGLIRAAWTNLTAGTVVQGGSTITQQAAKNLFLTPERTLKRKVQEVLLALWLEHRFTKDQILAIYLNRVYFGAGTYGVDAAARKYFDRPAEQVTTLQAAMLAGLLKAPSRYNPIANPDLAMDRARLVLSGMVDAGYLTRAQAATAAKGGKIAVASRERWLGGRYFVDWVMSLVPGFTSSRDADLVVHTTLDPRMQRLAETWVDKTLDSPALRKAQVGQAALVAMSPEGAVRAMVGGQDYEDSPFNRATQAMRQPGSAFKPIVFAAGLEAGLTPESRLYDSPIQVAGWSPRNFSGRYEGEVSMRYALAQSINTVAVRVAEYAGRSHVIDLARRIGVTSPLSNTPSLSLGAQEMSLVELTQCYAAFANGGYGAWAYGIEEIDDTNGNVLYSRRGSGPGRAISPQVARLMTGMLVDVVETGTGRSASFGRPLAGKTGTSQSFRDAWFVGYTADLITGVWMGNDDDTPMKNVTGGKFPAQLFRGFMKDALVGAPVRSLPSLTEPPSEPVPATDVDAEAPSLDFWERLQRVLGG